MKKLKFLILGLPLFLVACRPPIPDVEQAIQGTDPTTIVVLNNDATDAYYRSALPFVSSPTRGLIYGSISNRADIAQVEMSLSRLATDFFDPDDYLIRDGQYLTREFVLNVLRANNPEPTHTSESETGLNPAFGTEIEFRGATFESNEDDVIRPLAYLLEQNFVTVHDDDFHLEGVAIALALNPYYREIDFTTAFDHHWRMSDEQIIEFGQQTAAYLLPMLRQQPGLETAPIMIGLFILRRDNEVLPGNFTSIAFAESGRTVLGSWQPVHEQHFNLPDNEITRDDVNINDEFNFFSNAVRTYFPHQHSVVARAKVVDHSLYRVDITFNMTFLGLSEKIAFHQLLEQEVMRFSPEYDIRIIVRSPDAQHGSVIRRPHSEPIVTRISW